MPTGDYVTVPVQISPALLERARQKAAEVSPGKKLKITFQADLVTGQLNMGLGARVGDHFSAGVFVLKEPGRPVAGVAEGTFEWAPMP